MTIVSFCSDRRGNVSETSVERTRSSKTITKRIAFVVWRSFQAIWMKGINVRAALFEKVMKRRLFVHIGTLILGNLNLWSVRQIIAACNLAASSLIHDYTWWLLSVEPAVVEHWTSAKHRLEKIQFRREKSNKFSISLTSSVSRSQKKARQEAQRIEK